ncbi:MAG: 16S rRNA (uracil(1498)-N(3))-methyltransferase [Bacteroidales bacterium]
MQIFYAPDINGLSYSLGREESRHCVKVLRLREGSPVKLIDGKGNLFDGVIVDPDPAACSISIAGVVNNFEQRNYKLHLAVSPLKNPERYEWMVEKCVEMGIDEITPLLCKNTEKRNIRTDRLRNIIVSAMKQSLKAYLPVLNEPREFKDLLTSQAYEKKLIAHCNLNFKRVSVGEAYTRGTSAMILIGPEGDFTVEEIELATKSGFVQVHLGQSRLRTETAGIAACHSICFMNE